MFFTYVYKDGDKEHARQREAACFGATGRCDWYRTNPKTLTRLTKFSRGAGIVSPTDTGNATYVDWSKDVICIRLSTGFEPLFTTGMLPVWDYLVNRSWWSPMFRQTPEQIVNDNHVDFLVDKLPSEVQTWLHICCRDAMLRTTFPLSFSMLLSLGVPEAMAFAMSVVYRGISFNDPSTAVGTECVRKFFNFEPFIKNDINYASSVCELTMKDIGGYVMNISRLFDNNKKGIRAGSYVESPVTVEVKGLFTRQKVAVIDPLTVYNNIIKDYQ